MSDTEGFVIAGDCDVKSLRNKLESKRLLFIWIAMKQMLEECSFEENIPLARLLVWKRSDIIEAIESIDEQKNNNCKINVVQKNLFADIVCKENAIQKNNEQKNCTTTVSVENVVQMMENVQTYALKIEKSVKNMKEQLLMNEQQSLKKLHIICNSMKEEIDKKEKELDLLIHNLYYHQILAHDEKYLELAMIKRKVRYICFERIAYLNNRCTHKYQLVEKCKASIGTKNVFPSDLISMKKLLESEMNCNLQQNVNIYQSNNNNNGSNESFECKRLFNIICKLSMPSNAIFADFLRNNLLLKISNMMEYEQIQKPSMISFSKNMNIMGNITMESPIILSTTNIWKNTVVVECNF